MTDAVNDRDGGPVAKSSEQRARDFIEACSDPDKLKQMAANARARGAADIERAALLKLYSVLPSAEAGTLEHDVWQSIHALEGALKAERGKTVLLARTRQKIARDGELKTVADLVRGKETSGFDMLIERDMPELTFEAVALRHESRFAPAVLDSARSRLRAAGIAIT